MQFSNTFTYNLKDIVKIEVNEHNTTVLLHIAFVDHSHSHFFYLHKYLFSHQKLITAPNRSSFHVDLFFYPSFYLSIYLFFLPLIICFIIIFLQVRIQEWIYIYIYVCRKMVWWGLIGGGRWRDCLVVDRRERAQPAICKRVFCFLWECALSSSVIALPSFFFIMYVCMYFLYLFCFFI